MILDLKNMHVLWTTCDKFESRHPKMLEILNSCGLKHAEKISGPRNTPYSININNENVEGFFDDGMARGYLTAINKYKPPFLLLEDDIKPTHYHEIDGKFHIKNLGNINIPNDVDALYMGTSICGRLNKKTYDNVVECSYYDDTYCKIYNMLSLHAIIYLSDRYISHVSILLKNYIDYVENSTLEKIRNFYNNKEAYDINIHYGADDWIADNMRSYNILCFKKPVFFQDDGWSEPYTTSILNPYNPS